MIEAVGHEYWPTYFETLDRLLAPGGRVAIQAITMPHDRMLATRDTYTWINKYIFPGGFLPSVEAIEQITRDAHHAAGDRTGCRSAALRRDAAAVGRGVPRQPRRVRALGFDETFVRMWHFYLEYSGRLRLGLHRRPADDLRPGRRPDEHHASLRRRTGRCRRRRPRARPRARGGWRAAGAAAGLGRLGGRPRGRPGRRDPQSADALRRMLWHPGELGAAQAYVTGELEVHADLDDTLTHVWEVVRQRGLDGRPGLSALGRALGAARPRGRARSAAGTAGHPGPGPRPAAQQAPRPAAISHHYDLSNEFYGADPRRDDGLLVGYWRKAPGTAGYTSPTRSATSSPWSAARSASSPA
jgi:ADP-ribose pyrophosphatase YjhB (NUDIX family)